MANYKYIIDLIGNTGKFSSEMNKVNSQIEGIQKTVNAAALAVGAFFAVNKLYDMGVEAAQLAGQMQGVKEAFDKLNKPDLLSQLKKATKGTVSELVLMQNAVKAEKFRIPLDQLATYFQFATNTAAETGMSVDYLVDSIITGLGRESPLILDNLGISATQLSEKFKETGNFGEAAGQIIAEMMKKSGDVTLTAAQIMEQWKASIQEAKVAIGNGLLGAVTALDEAFQWIGSHLTELLAIVGSVTAAFLVYKGVAVATAIAQMAITAIGNIQAWFQLAKGVTSAKEAMILLSLATSASPIGLIAGLLAAAAAAFMIFRNKSTEAKDAQSKFNDELQRTDDLLGAKQYQNFLEQIGLIKTVITVLPDGTKRMVTEFDKGVNVIDKFKKSLKSLREDELENYKKFFESEIVTIQRGLELLDPGDITSVLENQKLEEYRKNLTLINSELAIYKKLKEGVDPDAAKAEADNLAYLQNRIKTIEKGQDSETKRLETMKELVDVMKEASGLDFSKGIVNPQELTVQTQAVENTTAALTRWGEKIKEVRDNMNAMLSAFAADTVTAFVDGITTAALEGTMKGWNGFFNNMLTGIGSFLKQFGAMLISYAIAVEAFKKGFANPIVALGAGIALVAAGAAITYYANKPMEFANGGIAYGPTLGMVGEYPGASSNPEVIAPLSKLRDLLGGGDGMGGTVEFKIKGSDLSGVLQRQRVKTNNMF